MLVSGTGIAVTPSDTVNLPKCTRALYVGVTGDVSVVFGQSKTAGLKITSIDPTTGAITGIRIENSGLGYQSAPTISVADTSNSPGSGAAFTCTVSNGRIATVTISTAGTGYKNIEEIQLTLTGGFAFVVLKALAAGIIHDLQVTKVLATNTTATNIVGLY